MNKLAELINNLKEDDLLKIKKDLLAGNIDKQIQRKLAKIDNYNDKICPVCSGQITKDSFKLEFGKDYLRKNAYFDGVDCLEYFVATKLKTKNFEQ